MSAQQASRKRAWVLVGLLTISVAVGGSGGAYAGGGGCGASDTALWLLIAVSVGLLVAALRVARASWPVCIVAGLACSAVLAWVYYAVGGIGACPS